MASRRDVLMNLFDPAPITLQQASKNHPTAPRSTTPPCALFR